MQNGVVKRVDLDKFWIFNPFTGETYTGTATDFLSRPLKLGEPVKFEIQFSGNCAYISKLVLKRDAKSIP